MSTYSELSEIFLAARTAAEFVAEAREDGKLTLSDLTDNLDLVLQFAGQVKNAIQIDGKLDLGELTKDEVKALLEYNLATVFIVTGVTLEGESEATYVELKEIFDAFSDGVALLAEISADGKISLGDIPTSLNNFIDLAKSVPAAVKIEAAIDLSTLSSDQAKGLLWQFAEDIYTIIESLKKFSKTEG